MIQPRAEKKEIRVLIIDDSRVARAMIGQVLHGTLPNVVIAGYADDGDSALSAIDVCNPDIIILDLAMPKMDGMTVLPMILKKKPGVRIVICSSITPPGSEISVRALFLGAAACIPKPLGTKNNAAIADCETALQQAVLGLYEAPVAPLSETPASTMPSLAGFTPRIIAIASSTGGPEALMTLLKKSGRLPPPVLITQHMMDHFTGPLARQLTQETGISCFEAQDGMGIAGGNVYIAPGGSHLVIKRSARGETTLHLDHSPPENFCRPSADVMLRSLVDIYGGSVLAVVLTGMGKDGLSGCKEVAKAGGRIIVQDKETSTVWGMPGSVANAGLAQAVLPLMDIGDYLKTLAAQQRNKT